MKDRLAMKISLLSLTYPPRDYEGISRQRYILASELAKRGHEVHVITLGSLKHDYKQNGVYVHRVNSAEAVRLENQALSNYINQSYSLYEGLRSIQSSFDVVDIPLWAAQPLIPQLYYKSNIIVWLQTTLTQILRIYERKPYDHEKALIGLEQFCIKKADGIIADSKSILDVVKSDYNLDYLQTYSVIPLGLPELTCDCEKRLENQFVNVIVVGRLEKRKGTPFLFEVLPTLLEEFPNLIIRFIGRDNSKWDGWWDKFNKTYEEYFKELYPQFSKRVLFMGYVPESKLNDFYNQADILLMPSYYESFGLVFLEAMRKKIPVVAFNVGAAREIFPNNKKDGALLIEPDNKEEFINQLGALIESEKLRNEIGLAGYERFLRNYTSDKMAELTEKAYIEICEQNSGKVTKRVYQVMEALNYGDAVSTIAINNASLLEELNQPPTILSQHFHNLVKSYVGRRSLVFEDLNVGLIFHYWNYNYSAWMLRTSKGRNALYFHNITPCKYFIGDQDLYNQIKAGYDQLNHIIDKVDLLIGDSHFNLRELSAYLRYPLPGICVYPVINAQKIIDEPFDTNTYESIKNLNSNHFLFVGRIARNKRQDKLLRLFDYYNQAIENNSHLWLVGDFQSDPTYYRELMFLKNSMRSSNNIHFVGKVSDQVLRAFYRAADIFISASEHEGFCMPLVESMVFDLPVVAYAAAAVPETMGKSGVLIDRWHIEPLSELINLIFHDHELRQKIINSQKINLRRFSVQEAFPRIKAVVDFLLDGKYSPYFEYYPKDRKHE